MKLKADFVKDWHDILRDILVGLDIDISKIKEEELPIVYFDAKKTHRTTRAQSKNLRCFQCPS